MQDIEERLHQYEPFFGEWYLGSPAEKLGQGQFGTVFTIHKGNQVAALKCISIPPNENYLRRLYDRYGSEAKVRQKLQADLDLAQREIQTLGRLNGVNNIMYFEDSRKYNRTDVPFGFDIIIRMEKLVPIRNYFKTIGHQDAPTILRIWDELLEGLKNCREQNLIHLDIKPENIFYSTATRYFKLGDFGVSQDITGKERVVEGMKVGTYNYMAPEIFLKQGCDDRADQYSLALMIYQWLNKDRLPFIPLIGQVTREDESHANELRWEGKQPIPTIRGVDRAVMKRLLKCLSFDPADRFADAEECQWDLRGIRKRKPPRPWVPFDPAQGKPSTSIVQPKGVRTTGAISNNGGNVSGKGNISNITPPDAQPPKEPELPPVAPAEVPGFPPQENAAPPADPGFPPQDNGFPPADPGFPPQDNGFPPADPGFPPADPGFPPQNNGFPPADPGFPPQNNGFPPQNPGFPPQNPGFPPANPGFPPQNNGFPPQGGTGMRVSIRETGTDGRNLTHDVEISGELRIGRADANDLSIRDGTVSGTHMRLIRRGAMLCVEDLGSRNRTYVNGIMVRAEYPLCSGDRITIGRTTLEIIF